MSFELPPIMTGKVCAYCNQPTVYVDSAEVYGGSSYGNIYLCRPCGAYVGVHKHTDIALGRVADANLRIAKKLAHDMFDRLWRLQAMRELAKQVHHAPQEVYKQNRVDAYAWLSRAMGVRPELCHIGMFDNAQCQQVVDLCLPFLPTTQPRSAVTDHPTPL